MRLRMDTALCPSFLHLTLKFKVRVRLDHGVTASYMTLCSAAIGGFCDLSHLVGFHCFLECFALQAA